jgi:hypothetical protein
LSAREHSHELAIRGIGPDAVGRTAARWGRTTSPWQMATFEIAGYVSPPQGERRKSWDQENTHSVGVYLTIPTAMDSKGVLEEPGGYHGVGRTVFRKLEEVTAWASHALQPLLDHAGEAKNLTEVDSSPRESCLSLPRAHSQRPALQLSPSFSRDEVCQYLPSCHRSRCSPQTLRQQQPAIGSIRQSARNSGRGTRRTRAFSRPAERCRRRMQAPTTPMMWALSSRP